MVSYLQTQTGEIWAYIEWQILNKDGQFEDDGEYIYVQDLWINEERRTGFGDWRVIKKLIPKIANHRFSNNAKFVQWCRHKYNDRQSRLQTVAYYLRRINHGQQTK